MKSRSIPTSDIIYSYKILFPNEKNIINIDANLLKSAYRKLVFQNHPDRFRFLNIKESELKDRMIKINSAYETISSYLKNKNVAGTYHRTGTEAKKKHSKTDNRNNFIPKKKIFFGQFLYYSGNINLSTLLSALSWQRLHRENFGRIAINWKILDSGKLVSVLKLKKPYERIGECALRLGYINNFQLTAILAKQKNAKKPIGEYFIKNNLIDKNEIERFAKLHKQHNYIYI